jgi:hypothetical protein
MTSTRKIIAAGALALGLVAPAAAHAATITYAGDTLVYRAAPGEKNSTGPSTGLFDESRLRISDSSAVPIAAPADRCIQHDDFFECDMPAKAVFDVGDGDGDDHVSFSFSPPGLAAEAFGGDGNDLLEGYVTGGGPLAQVLDGGAGNDKLDGDLGNDVVRGGPGDDEVDGGAGDDRVEGNEGNDTLYGDHYEDPAHDVVDGGAGFDLVSDYDQPGKDFNPPVAISFDGVANDGRPGENDNLIGVERLESSVHGTFAGGPGDDQFFVKANLTEGPSTITGGAGNDRLTGWDHDETIDGGPGDDRVEGGYSDDVLTGGPGRDQIFGDSTTDTCHLLSCKVPFGNDVINARDGEQDTIDCGVGQDRATVDAIDVVANCEIVDKSGMADPPADGKLNGPKRYTRKALKKGLAAAFDCPAAFTVKVTLTADRKTAKTLRTRLIASGRARSPRPGR